MRLHGRVKFVFANVKMELLIPLLKYQQCVGRLSKGFLGTSQAIKTQENCAELSSSRCVWLAINPFPLSQVVRPCN